MDIFFIGVFTVSVLALCTTERFIHAIFRLIWVGSPEQKTRSEQVIGAGLQFFMHIFSGCFSLVFRFLGFFGNSLITFFVLWIFLALLYVSYEEYSVVWFSSVEFYNEYVGKFIHKEFRIFLEWINLMFRVFTPLWNTVIWFGRMFIFKGFIPIVFQNLITFFSMTVHLVGFFRHFFLEMSLFLKTLNTDMLANPVEMDFKPALEEISNIGISLVTITNQICGVIRIPVQIILFPFVEPYFVKGFDKFFNGVIELFIRIPMTTHYRHSLYNVQYPTIASTPDVESFFNYIFHSMDDFGRGFDSWVRYSLNVIFNEDVCQISNNLESVYLTNEITLQGKKTVLGLNRDWIALTNGSIAVFQSMNGLQRLNRFSSTVDVSFGIAAVYTQEKSLNQDGLFGCMCTNTALGGIQVSCFTSSLETFDGGYSTKISFPDNVWTSKMECSNFEIHVKSVRFPVRRYDTQTINTQNCISKKTCESIDATVWLIPLCLQKTSLCNAFAIGTNCYPFCLATRIRGKPNQKMIFVNADQWRTGKQVLFRDCFGLNYRTDQASLLNDDWVQANNESNCRSSNEVGTFLTNTNTNDLSRTNIRSEVQPFAISGDTILRGIETSNGQGYVIVERLTGNQQDVFFLQDTMIRLEAAPRQNIPMDQFTFQPDMQVFIPLEFQTRRIYSTSSEKYVFYTQSPNLNLFSSFLNYCANKNQSLPQFQFMIFSSYSPMRIFRVQAYCVSNCLRLSAQVTLEGFAGKDLNDRDFVCGKKFNASIDGIEYVNSENIAVIVQEADMTYDATKNFGSGSLWKIYWLHPETMRLRSYAEGMWNQSSTETIGHFECRNLIMPPRLGTLAFSLLRIPLHLVHFVVTSILYTPGIIYQWETMGDLCPKNTYNHFVLETCGSSLYDNTAYWNSVDVCQETFWEILVYVRQLFSSKMKGKVLNVLEDILDGVAQYGRVMIPTQDLSQGVGVLLQTPVIVQIQNLWVLVSTQNAISSGKSISFSVFSWGRFASRLFRELTIEMVKATIIVDNADNSVVDWVKVMWTVMKNTLYDLHLSFDTFITISGKSGCSGIQIIFGGNNPWAKVIYHWCVSGHELTNSLYTFFNVVFVEVPTIKCVCQETEIIKTCLDKSPISFRPVLIQVFQNQDRCEAVIQTISTRLSENFNGYFEELSRTLDAVGDSVDYALTVFDDSAGQCTNFDTNPNVVVILPEPIDYFRSCAKTESCHSKCWSTWSRFQVAKKLQETSSRTVTISANAESYFFPYPVEDIVRLGKPIALQTSPSKDEIWVCFWQDTLQQILVQQFAISANPVIPVTKTTSWSIAFPFGSPHKGFFLDDVGEKVIISVYEQNDVGLLYEISSLEVKTSLNTTDLLSKRILALTLLGHRSMQLIDFFVVQTKVIATIGVRTQDGVRYGIDKKCLYYDTLDTSNSAYECNLPESIFQNFVISEFPGTNSILMWPVDSSSVEPLFVTFSFNVNTVQISYLQTITRRDFSSSRSLILSKQLIVDQTNSMWFIYAVDNFETYDWLLQLRIQYSENGNTLTRFSFHNSQQITTPISIQLNCNELDCRGCTPKNLYALCMAYQTCSVAKCIGTPVNLNRPLCGVGLVMKSYSSLTLESVKGAYTIFSEMFFVMLKLKNRKNIVGDLTWPDETFFGYVCTAKDMSAEFTSILTSTVNSIIQLSQTGGPLIQKISNIDSSSHVSLSMTMSAMTGFFYQIFLFPIYSMTISRSILLCQAQGLISLFHIQSTGYFSIDLVSAEYADSYSAMTGVCLTESMNTQSLQLAENETVSKLGFAVAEIFTNIRELMKISQLVPFMHTVDGILSYISGILYKFGDLLTSLNLQKCLMPNVYAADAMTCACGDTALQIPLARQKENMIQKGHWCSGTMFLTKPNGDLDVVYNPFSYSELLALVTEQELKSYLDCLETSVICNAPSHPIFSQQGFNIIQIITKCRWNYVNKQWDAAAYVLYNPTESRRKIKLAETDYRVLNVVDPVSQCLVDSAADGITNGACLDLFMNMQNLDESYWKYDQSDKTLKTSDGCVVFSGGAKTNQKFKDCLIVFDSDESCLLSNNLWSPLSDNTVPVAFPHVIQTNDSLFVDEQYQKAYDLVVPILERLQNYSNPNLKVGLFSAEGDVIHQLMDCVFLGPYAQMDYWPQMFCEPKDSDCLRGFKYYRNEGNDQNFLKRGCDPRTCQKASTLPFTCGSPNRKALIKYFVNVILLRGQNGNEIMNEFIRTWVQDLLFRWQNVSKYSEFDPETYLPMFFDTQNYVYLNTSNVLGSIGFNIEWFFNETKFSNTPWHWFLDSVEKEKYDWKKVSENWVEDNARYDLHNSARSYTKNEAMSPPVNDADTSLWQNCHGALRQLLFTLPLEENSDSIQMPPNSIPFVGGGVDAFEQYIQKLTQKAMEKSPLFQHYYPVHKPSDSVLCAKNFTLENINTSLIRTLRFSDFKIDNILIYPALNMMPILVRGAEYADPGLAGDMCFCGWSKTNTTCIAPSTTCVLLQNIGIPCVFSVSDAKTISELTKMYNESWECPLYEFSDQYGFLDRETNELWLDKTYEKSDLTMSLDSILRYGAGGIRIGNMETLPQVVKKYIHPRNHEFDPKQGILHGCNETKSEDLLKVLFPMAQGIEDSPVTSYCLRFMIEYSKWIIYDTINDDNAIKLKAAEQQQTVSLWKRRCGSQVQTMALCKSLDMFVPNPYVSDYCRFLWVLDNAMFGYISPECLVITPSKIYDPCFCNRSLCNNASRTHVLVISTNWLESECTVSFDPRTVVAKHEMGWWEESTNTGIAKNTWLKEFIHLFDSQNLLDNLNNLRLNTEKNSVESWMTAEGYMHSNSEYCDNVADYWDDNWLFPVGYHVTMPCDKDDIGYKSFDNVFSVDRETDPDQIFLVYMEDQTRDINLVDSNFGANGLCRMHNFGMNMYETNTMRLCTRTQESEKIDPHIPRSSQNFKNIDINTEQCSASSKDVPWSASKDYSYYDAALTSIGTVPNLPYTGSFYPESGSFFVPGNLKVLENEGWGTNCQDFDLPTCNCPENYYCVRTVCVSNAVECLSHRDCRDNQLCNGIGQCADSQITFSNELNESVEFHANSEDCGQDGEFSMLGASFWAYVPDLLETHGMCSYRNWREYLHTLNTCSCSVNALSQEKCTMNAENCTLYDFEREENNAYWWNANVSFPNRLKLMPTTCDRDWERMKYQNKELKHCFPKQAKFLAVDKTVTDALQYSSFIRTYSVSNKKVEIARMPFRQNTTYGFLGNAQNLQRCGALRHCYADNFYVNGALSMKNDVNGLKVPNRSNYNAQDIFQCGIIGMYQKPKCRIDLKLFPLYDIFCIKKNFVSSCSTIMDVTKLATICANIQLEYEPNYNIIADVNVYHLQQLFYSFLEIKTLYDHTNMTECIFNIYNQITTPVNGYVSRNLYFPFDFTVLEIPFSWFYQCMIGERNVLDVSFSKDVYVCASFRDRVSMTEVYRPLTSADSLKTYVYRIQGAYTKTSVESYISQYANEMKRLWRESVQYVRSTKFSNYKRVEPYCYKQRNWVLENIDEYAKTLIYFQTNGVCDVTYNEYIKSLYNEFNPTKKILSKADQDSVLTRQNTYSEQQTNEEDILRVMQTFGEAFIDSDFRNIDKLYRVLTSTSTEKFPLLYSLAMPDHDSENAINVLYKNLAKDTRFRVYTNTFAREITVSECNPNSVVNLFPGHSDPILKDVKICLVYDVGYFSCELPQYTYDKNKIYTFNYQNALNGESTETYMSGIYRLILDRFRFLQSQFKITSLSPSTMPFYEQENSVYQKNIFELSLLNVKKYINNINPDTSIQFMCVLGNNEVDFTECTNPHFLTLQKHVSQNFVFDGPVVVPAYTQMDWKTKSNMLKNGFLAAYSVKERPLNRLHLLSWLNNDTVCNSFGTKIDDRVCSFFSASGTSALQKYESVSPWSAGLWNFMEKCDVYETDILEGYQEIIDINCYMKNFCPFNSNQQIDYSQSYYTQMPNYQECIRKQNSKATFRNVRKDTQYNLCRGNLYQDDDICLHLQGMVGGSDGFPTQDSKSLYELFELRDLPEGVEEGYIKNILFSASESNKNGFLKQNSDHIGGHHVGFKLNNNGLLSVYKMPLTKIENILPMSEWNSEPVSVWIKNLQDSWKTDHANYKVFSQVLSGSNLGWDCPIRRRSYYAGSSSIFHPFLPSAKRSEKLFIHMTNSSYFAHPTQKREDAANFLGVYITSNGFCYCPISEEVPDNLCSVAFSQNHNCSLFQTINVLAGKEWGWSHVFQPRTKFNTYKTCTLQLDWPFIPGTLRDNSTFSDSSVWEAASDPELKRCHVLDRLPNYQYTYKSSNTMNRAEFHTIQKGVCHTGRMQPIIVKESRRCVLSQKLTDSVSVLCLDRDVSKQTVYNLIREKSTLVHLYRGRRKRQFCNQCSTLPKFKTRGLKNMRNESSFGQAFRISAETKIMEDMKKVLCKNNTKCLELLNSSNWQKGKFFNSLLKSPQNLIITQPRNVSRSVSTPIPDDSSLWNANWVYCNTPAALSSGKDCKGSISKRDWESNRGKVCHKVISDVTAGQKDIMGETSICDVSSELTELCVAIEKAKKIIQGINCYKAKDPKCALEEYVYTPSTWDTSNNAFVHQTVQEFYKRSDISVCPINQRQQALINQNAQTLLECPAIPVYGAYILINTLRDITYRLCDAFVRFFSLLMNLFLSIFKKNEAGGFYSAAVVSWKEFVRGYKEIFSKATDLWVNSIMSSGVFGVWLQENLKNSCQKVNTILNTLRDFWCRVLVEYVPIVVSGVQDVLSYIDTGFQVINDFITTLIQNYVPEAILGMIAQGYTKDFQKSLVGQKQQAYKRAIDTQIDANRLEQKSALTNSLKKDAINNPQKRPTLMTKVGNSFSKLGKNVAKGAVIAGGVAGGAAAGVSLFMDVLEIADTLETAQKIEKALELMPDYWTLFDFTTIQYYLQELVVFTRTNSFCFQYVNKNDNILLNCNWFNLLTSESDAVRNIIPYATQCWAEAQIQDIGTTTLYACTGTSVCCKDVYCTEKIACSGCPLTTDSFQVSYGCNTMTQRCQCTLPKKTISRCLTHRECMTESSNCKLMSYVDDISYGSVECNQCATEPVCIFSTDSSDVGQCSCLPSTQKNLALCRQKSLETIFPKASLICGFQSMYEQIQSYYYWNDLSFALCGSLENIICVEVLTDSSTSMILGVSNRFRQQTTQTSTRRLLGLSVENLLTNSSWNDSNTACGDIIFEYLHQTTQNLEIETKAYQCGYWRFVGKQIIHDYNLTDLVPYDNFLLSMNDFSMAMIQKNTWEQILSTPQIWSDIFFYSSFGKNIQFLAHRYLGVSPKNFLVYGSKPNLKNTFHRSHQRKTLQTQYDEILKKFSLPLDLQNIINEFSSSAKTSDYWTNNDMLWPLAKWEGDCPIFDVTYTVTVEITDVLIKYYTNFDSKVILKPGTYFQNLRNYYPVESPRKSLISVWLHEFAKLFQIEISDIMGLFIFSKDQISLQKLWNGFIYCNIDTVMFCNSKKADLLPTLVTVIILYVILYYVCNLFGVPFVATIFFGLIPFFVLYFCYDVAYGCFPMIPTCVIDEMIVSINKTFPSYMVIPHEMVMYTTNTTKTLRSCSEFGFISWTDSFNFWLQIISGTKYQTTQWICAFVTLIYLLPVLIVIVGIFFLLIAFLIFIFSLVPSWTFFVWNIMIQTHS